MNQLLLEDSPISVFDADSVFCGEDVLVVLRSEAFVAGLLQMHDAATLWPPPRLTMIALQPTRAAWRAREFLDVARRLDIGFNARGDRERQNDVHFGTLEREQQAVRIHDSRLCDFEQANPIVRGQFTGVVDR
jgi:hypothetical protein